MFESPDCQVIRQACEEFYQSRTELQTQRVSDVIKEAFPQATHEKIKLYSFFADIVESHQDLQKIQLNSPLYLLQRNEHHIFQKYEILHKIDLAKFDLSKFTLCIAPQSKIKCEMLSSIDDEIRWLQGNQYFGDLQKKRLYHLIRSAEILTYKFNNNVYCEGDILQPGHGCLFLVKEGEFCFKKNKNLMLYNFGAREIFGHQEVLSEHEHKKRQFSVSCTSSYGVVFKISEEFFNYYLKKNCEQHLKLNIDSVSKFIGKQIEKVQTSRQKNQLLLTQNLSFRKTVSVQNKGFASVPKLLKSSKTILQGIVQQKASKEQKLPFISVKSQFGLNNVVKRQRISLPNPEYQQDGRLINKKIKLQVLKNYTKGKTSESRGQILLNLIKNSWHFQRNRKKKILSNN